MMTKFNIVIGDNLAHETPASDFFTICLRSAENWMRILIASAKIMHLPHVDKATKIGYCLTGNRRSLHIWQSGFPCTFRIVARVANIQKTKTESFQVRNFRATRFAFPHQRVSFLLQARRKKERNH